MTMTIKLSNLSEQQDNFIDTINDGPDLLDPRLFSGPIDRIMLGLKAHANTISHARLVALEETFPRTRHALGEDTFNALSRDYCDTAEARACDNNNIGANFADYISGILADASTGDLARIEWTWLASYHAIEAEPLTLLELSTIPESALLSVSVDRHPAAMIVMLNAPLSAELDEVQSNHSVTALLITRPKNEVQLVPLSALDAAIFAFTQNSTNIGNLLSQTIEQDSDEALGPILKLIGAGALMKAR